jgi:hypothetical protein
MSIVDRIRKQLENANLFAGCRGDRIRDRIFPGHFVVGPVTVYGANAMHYAVNIRTRWGYLCARPTTGRSGYWPWYVYLSENATPERATWGFGPGFQR